MSNELQHFGVLGMKWGVRRFQKPDGSLTSAGRARYNEESESESQPVKESRKTSDKGASGSFSDYEEANRASLTSEKKAYGYANKAKEYGLSQKDLLENGAKSETFKAAYGRASDLPDKAFKNIFGKSKDDAASNLVSTAKKLQEKNEKAAQAKREGRLTDDQKFAIAAGLIVAATAATAYGVYRYKNNQNAQIDKFIGDIRSGAKKYALDDLPDVDMTIKSGDVLKRIAGKNENYVKDTFYSAWKDQDVQRYLGVYAPGQATFNTGNKELYQNSLKAIKDIKIPSQKNMLESYVKLVESQSTQERADFWRGGMGDVGEKAMESYMQFEGQKHKGMSSREYAEETFERFVSSLVNQEDRIQSQASKYFNILSEKGYGAILDTSDKGSIADLPLIAFNGKSSFELEGRTKITPSVIRKAQAAIKLLDS